MVECLGEAHERRDGRFWFFEPEVLFLTLFVVLAYFVRAGELPLRGEEPTRAQMAFEMVSGNDFLVPRAQGQPVHRHRHAPHGRDPAGAGRGVAA